MKTLKLLPLLILSLFLSSLSGCDDIEVINQNVNSKSVVFDLPPQPAGEYVFTQDIAFNFDSLVDQFGISLLNLTSVTPQSVTLTIIDASATPVTFDLLDHVELSVLAATLTETMIASKNPVPHTGVSTLALDVNNSADILAFANTNNVTIKLKAGLNAPLDHQVQIKADVKWHITAELN
jgi:hypothetical protein